MANFPRHLHPTMLIRNPADGTYWNAQPTGVPLTEAQIKQFCNIQDPDNVVCKLKARKEVFDGDALASLYAMNRSGGTASTWYLHLEGLRVAMSHRDQRPFIHEDQAIIGYEDRTPIAGLGTRISTLNKQVHMPHNCVPDPDDWTPHRFLRFPALVMWNTIPYESWRTHARNGLMTHGVPELVRDSGLNNRLRTGKYDLYFPTAGYRGWYQDEVPNLTPFSELKHTCKFLRPATRSDIVFEFKHERLSIYSVFRQGTSVWFNTAPMFNTFDNGDACMDHATRIFLSTVRRDLSTAGQAGPQAFNAFNSFIADFLENYLNGEFNNDASNGQMESMAIAVERGKDPTDLDNQIPISALMRTDPPMAIRALSQLRTTVDSEADLRIWQRTLADQPPESAPVFPKYTFDDDDEDENEDEDEDEDEDEYEEQDEYNRP